MTKAEMIAIYGEAWYAEQQAKNRVRALKRYHEHPELRPPQSLVNERVKKWRSKPGNLEKHKAFNREYWREKFAAMTPEERAKYTARHSELRKKRRASETPEQHASRRAKEKAAHDAWRDKNRDHVNASSNAWRKANPGLVHAMVVAAMAKRRAAGPIDTKFVLWLRSQPCVDCGATEMIEVGHIVPVKLGGTNDPANLIPQCRSCNRRLSSHQHRLAPKD